MRVARRAPAGFEYWTDRNPPEPGGPLCFTATSVTEPQDRGLTSHYCFSAGIPDFAGVEVQAEVGTVAELVVQETVARPATTR